MSHDDLLAATCIAIGALAGAFTTTFALRALDVPSAPVRPATAPRADVVPEPWSAVVDPSRPAIWFAFIPDVQHMVDEGPHSGWHPPRALGRD